MMGRQLRAALLALTCLALLIAGGLALASTATAGGSGQQPSAHSTITGWAKQPTARKTVTGWAKQPTDAKTITGWKTSRECGGASLHCGTSCVDVGSDAHVCLELAWKLDGDGTGGTLVTITETISGGFWESHAVDCYNLRVWNDASEVKWRRDGNECDVERNLGYRYFPLNLHMGQTQDIHIGWSGNANLDKETDHDFHVPAVIHT